MGCLNSSLSKNNDFLPVDFVLGFSLSAEEGASLGPAVAAVSFELPDEALGRFLLDEHGHLHDAAHVANANPSVRKRSLAPE